MVQFSSTDCSKKLVQKEKCTPRLWKFARVLNENHLVIRLPACVLHAACCMVALVQKGISAVLFATAGGGNFGITIDDIRIVPEFVGGTI